MNETYLKSVSFTCIGDKCEIHFGRWFEDVQAKLVFPISLYDEFLKSDYEHSDWGTICRWLDRGNLVIVGGEKSRQ